MSHACPTVKVVASDPAQGDFVVINEADFDPAQHKRYGEAAPAPAPKKTKAAAAPASED